MEEGETRSAEFFNTNATFNQGIGILIPLYHIGGIKSQNGVMDCACLGKFPDSLEFRSQEVNFKTEVRANSVSQTAMHWIKEVEKAK